MMLLDIWSSVQKLDARVRQKGADLWSWKLLPARRKFAIVMAAGSSVHLSARCPYLLRMWCSVPGAGGARHKVSASRNGRTGVRYSGCEPCGRSCGGTGLWQGEGRLGEIQRAGLLSVVKCQSLICGSVPSPILCICSVGSPCSLWLPRIPAFLWFLFFQPRVWMSARVDMSDSTRMRCRLWLTQTDEADWYQVLPQVATTNRKMAGVLRRTRWSLTDWVVPQKHRSPSLECFSY